MPGYLAKGKNGELCEECQHCHCYTKSGWLLKGQNQTVFFVCPDCFEEGYRAQSIIQDFDTQEFLSDPNVNPYRLGSRFFRRLCVKLSKSVRVFKAALLVWCILAPAVYCYTQRPRFVMPDIRPPDAIMKQVNKTVSQLHRYVTNGG